MAYVGHVVDDRELERLGERLEAIAPTDDRPREAGHISLAPDLELVVEPYRSRAGRMFDISIGMALLFMCLPVLAVLALATRLDSRGPVLFRQTRSGIGGEPFTIFKFRTMRQGGDRELEKLLEKDSELSEEFEERAKLAEDPRVSRIGRIVRPLGLDELPQLVNVVRGDMSIVGPRPIAIGEEVRYGDKAPLLWSVKPGLTGVWQLNGRNDTTYEERVDFDMQYVSAKSVRFDAQLLAQTSVRFLRGRLHGGY